jgi:hypothetical protein
LSLLGLQTERVAKPVEPSAAGTWQQRWQQRKRNCSSLGFGQLESSHHHRRPPDHPLDPRVVGRKNLAAGLDVGPQIGRAGVRSPPPADGVHGAARCDPRTLWRGEDLIRFDAQNFERGQKRIGVGVFGIDVNTRSIRLQGLRVSKSKIKDIGFPCMLL